MNIPLRILAFLCATSMGWAQPFGLTNRVANTTLRMPLTPTPTINYRIPPDNPVVGAKAAPPGFTSIEPITDYGRTEGFSVTGGFVYRGANIPELYGAYVFADYGSGRIWQMRYEVSDGVTNITPRSAIATNTAQTISCFGADPSDGDILFGDLGANRL